MNEDTITKQVHNSNLDVICQFCSDGRIIPLRIRVKDEDGEFHAYTIHEYKDLSHRGDIEIQDGLETHNDVYAFDCVITVFKKKKCIRLYYKSSAYSSEGTADF